MTRRQLEMLGLAIGVGAFGLGLVVGHLPAVSSYGLPIGLAILVGVLVWLVAAVWRVRGAVQKIAEDVEVMRLSNPEHRVSAVGFPRLEEGINRYADGRKGKKSAELLKLTFTAFDTETTGLDSSADEIVSFGAVQIVNGRLREDNFFERLVNPQRGIPESATEVHGISAETVQNAATVKDVIPEFANYCAETVILGHNIAFDMRLIELKEDVTGIHMNNPVLDTLLLASALYPDRNDYSLEAIGQMLGVPFVNRHDARADAVIAAKIFLKLLPILEERGVNTLEQALEFSETSFLSQLVY